MFVWIITCVLFGCLHGANIFLGAPAGSTLLQVLDSAAAGSVFSIVRRVTGSLIWAMALHGFRDFSLFVAGVSGATNPLAPDLRHQRGRNRPRVLGHQGRAKPSD